MNKKIKERRRFPRKKCLNLAFYYINLNGFRVQGTGRVLNISPKGALIETDKKLPTAISLKLDIAIERFYHLKASVVWTKEKEHGKYFAGVEFDRLYNFPNLEYL